MATKLTENVLVNKLDAMTHEELKEIIVDLYKSSKSAEERISLLLLDEQYGKELLDKYKKQLNKLFNLSIAVEMGFSLHEAQKILKDFSDVCANNNGRWYGDLALYFAECAMDFTMHCGDIDEEFYDALGDAYSEAVKIASENEELYKLWKDRMENIMHEFSGFGWGMEEFIADKYYSIPWIEE